MMAYSEVYLRCPQLPTPAARWAICSRSRYRDDILSKITLKSGVGTIVETGSDDGHFMGRLACVRLRGSSLSFVLFLDHV